MSVEIASEVIRQIAQRKGYSQTELAKRSGVSRVQINRIFAGTVENVRAETIDRLAEALGIRAEDFPGIGVLEKYRALVIKRLGRKSFAGLGLPDLPELRLSTIFVAPLGVQRDWGETRSQFCETKVGACDGFEDTGDRSNPLPADQLLAASPRTVILGCPGAGKTTLLQHIAVVAAEGKFVGSNIPVFIRLPEFASALEKDSDLNFVDWIVARAQNAECPGLGAELYKALKSRQSSVLFLLDGLDEVPSDGLRRKVIAATSGFVRRYVGNRFALASRTVGFDESPWEELGFSTIRLIEYGDEQLRATVEKWAAVLAPRAGETPKNIAAELNEAICGNPRVRQIASNPLVLTILIFLCRSRGYALPRRRVDLYQKVTEVFLESWEASKRKSIGYSETRSIDLDTRELNWLIADLALAMQRAGIVTAKRWWLADHIQEMLCRRIGFTEIEAKEKTDAILRFISHRTGMLEERANDLFAFSHRTLQEYFAAIGLIEEAELNESRGLADLVRQFVYHPEWKEVIRLVAAQISPHRAEELIRVMLDDPEPIGRLLHRGPILALHCLSDGTTIANRKLLSQIYNTLDDLGGSPWLGITMEVLGALNALRGTRYEHGATEASERILTIARKELGNQEHKSLQFSAARSVEVDLKGWNGSDEGSSPVIVGEMKTGIVTRRFVIPNFELLTTSFGQWYEAALDLIESPDAKDDVKAAAISAMGVVAKQKPKARSFLRDLLRNAKSKCLKIAAAQALESVAIGVQKSLIGLIKDRKNAADLREACIYSLRSLVPTDASLVELFLERVRDANEDATVRTACAYAIFDSVEGNDDVAKSLAEIAELDNTPTSLGMACIHSLEGVADRYYSELTHWAFGNDVRARAACQVLAEAISAALCAWDENLVLRIEVVLGGLRDNSPFGEPCPHVLGALRALLDARERMGGLRAEKVLAQSLKLFASRLRFAFIFGSVARNAQDQDSDLDLMLIGKVSLRDVASPIRQAESQLGRRINPVIYSDERFAELLQSGNPFGEDVMRKPKKPILLEMREYTETELNDELRAMATERLVASS